MKKVITLAIYCFVLIQTGFGQTNLQGISDSEGREIMTMIKTSHLAQASLAYQSAAIQRMLPEVNYFSDRLRLSTLHPIQLFNVKNFHIAAPWYSMIEDTNIVPGIARIRAAKIAARGVIETTNYFFSFDKGRLLYVCRMENGENYINVSKFNKWAATPSLINNSQAYQLATQWLSAVSVDVPALEQKYKLSFYQWFVWGSEKTNQIMLPIFDVKWGEGQMQLADETAAKVTILGTTKELMELQIGDESFSHRPQMIITNALELSSTPNPPMKRLESSPGLKTNSP